MLLRNHPLISYSGAPSWPPAWTWTGGLDNNAFCRQVVELLLANRNRPIVEIGNLDVSHSL